MTPADHRFVTTYVLGQSASLARRTAGRARRVRCDERGEGVISAAIAVLVMAFLGAAMWIGFKAMWDTTESKVDEKVNEIGS